MSPARVFVALASVVAAVAAVVLLTRPADTPAEPAPSPSESDHTLTNAEAIARFKELKALRDRAYHDRDASLAPLIYTSSSGKRRTIRTEIASLIEDGVKDQTRFVTRDIQVVSNGSTRILLAQTEDVYPEFVTEEGRDITRDARPQRQRVEWTLSFERGTWLVERILIVESKPLGRA